MTAKPVDNSFRILLCFLYMCCFCIIAATFVCGGKIEAEANPIVETPAVEDEILLKQREMRDTVTFVKTIVGSGSGTIIDRLDTDTENMYEYRVLTNAHITHSRFISRLKKVDAITGKVETQIVDMGCQIVIFNHQEGSRYDYKAIIIIEDTVNDLALLSFNSDRELDVAKIAREEMLKQVRVFDEVFVVGCQFGETPIPTIGIISQIRRGTNNEKEWVVYLSTAQIAPGSSGGGLFKKYDGHYYLIGIPYRVGQLDNGQIIPHLSLAISMSMARNFIDQNSVSHP